MRMLITILISLFFTSCNRKLPDLELSSQNPYVLKIKNFEWGYGTIEFNKLHGDFEKLDQQVFTALKGKNGFCKVYMEVIGSDKDGAKTSEYQYIGDIKLSFLNRFKSWEYWHDNEGIRTLVLNANFPTQIDSVAN